MMITLAYNNDLSRVQIALSALPFDEGAVRIERSTNEMFWQTVRGGTALSVSGGAASLDDFEFAADVENFYRVILLEPDAGLLLPGASGDYASTPDHASLDITADIGLGIDATMDDWQSSTQQLVAKWTETGQQSYTLRINADGTLRLTWSTDGTATTGRVSTAAIPADAGRLAVLGTLDVDNGASGHTVTFYTAETIDGPWTQLGDPIITGGTTSIFSSTSAVNVGAHSDGTSDLLTAIVHAALIKTGAAIGSGTIVADPVFEDQATGATSFTDDAGRLWTINGNAEIIGEVLEADSITPSLDGQTWLKSIRHPFLNRPVILAELEAIERRDRTGVFDVSGRSIPIAVSDLRAGQQFPLMIRTETFEQARDMDLILASGDTFLIHVPPECPLAVGGYVTIGTTAQRRAGRAGHYHFNLPCTVVAQPSPLITGGTMTYGALLNLYGGYNNVLAANPTYAALLDLMASPDDLVVI